MSRPANPTLIGGFVLGALALLVAALIAIGSGGLLRERVAAVTFFPGSVQGLSPGAQVLFQGVPIGRVTGVSLDYLPQRNRFRIPVAYDIWPRDVRILGGEGGAPRALIKQMVDAKGLRARLQPVSFVTGQYVVALSLNPRLEAPPDPGQVDGALVIPALEATRDRVENLLDNLQLNDLVAQASGTLAAIHDLVTSGTLTAAIEQFDRTLAAMQTLADDTGEHLPPLFGQIDRLLAQYAALAIAARAQLERIAPEVAEASQATAQVARHLDAQIPALAGAATRALDETARTMHDFGHLTDEASGTRQQLDELLSEATRATRALRELADLLERQPEALLRGKH